jgi:putative MFS transporter
MAFFWLPGGVPVLLPALSLVLIGQLASYPVIAGYATEIFPTALRGQASAWSTIAKVAGTATSLAFGGMLLTVTGGLPATTTILIGGPLVGTLIVAVAFPDTHGRELEQTSGDLEALPADLVGRPLVFVPSDDGSVVQ